MSQAFNWLLKIVANRMTKQFKEKIESAFERQFAPNFEIVLIPFNGSVGITETPFEGESQSSTPGFGYDYAIGSMVD